MKALIILLSLIGTQALAAEKLNWDSCSVVEVTSENDHLLEEGLGSIYDIDEDGNSNADGDSTGASVSIDGKFIEVSLGQGGWSTPNDKITVTTEEVENDITEKVINLTIDDDGQIYKVRLLTQKKIGFIHNKNKRGHFTRWAMFDCSGVDDPRNR